MNIVDDIDKFGRGGGLKIVNGFPFLEFFDNYVHFDTNIEYILENIIDCGNRRHRSNSYQDLMELYNSCLLNSCDCKNDSNCWEEINNCIHGGNYRECIYNNKKELVLNKNRKCKDLLYECSQNCHCSVICPNRLVQFGPRKSLKIIKCSYLNNQYGLSTSESIPMGGFICEYAGEILTKTEAKQRNYYNEINNKMNYIICLNESAIEGESCNQTFIDPSSKGNIGRYLNHSCDPNCEIFSIRVDNPVPKLGIFAKKHINANDELTFDYGEALQTFSFENINLKKCLCGMANCRKYLPNINY